MNKKVALTRLIEASLLLSTEEKLALLDELPAFNDRQVEALGKFLAKEREIVLENEGEILSYLQKKLAELEKSQSAVPTSASGAQAETADKVYVGVGKPS